MAAAIPVASLILAAGTTAYGVASSEDQKRTARLSADSQANAQSKAQKELQDHQLTESAQAENEVLRARQRALRGGAGGRRSTILDAAIGGSDLATQSGGKTAIGA